MAAYGIVDKVVTELVQDTASGSPTLTDQDCLKACKTVDTSSSLRIVRRRFSAASFIVLANLARAALLTPGAIAIRKDRLRTDVV